MKKLYYTGVNKKVQSHPSLDAAVKVWSYYIYIAHSDRESGVISPKKNYFCICITLFALWDILYHYNCL